VVEVQLLVAESAATILASVRIAEIDIAAAETDLATRDSIIGTQQEHAGDAQGDTRRAHGFGGSGRIFQRKLYPLLSVEHAMAGGVGVDGRGTPAEKQTHRPKHAHDINRLPETVKNEDAMFEARGHVSCF
jgi:hypothetical protein